MSTQPILGDHTLPNGRQYRIIDTGKPYVGGEYPSGGLRILVWLNKADGWAYLDNSPDETTARAFLATATQLRGAGGSDLYCGFAAALDVLQSATAVQAGLAMLDEKADMDAARERARLARVRVLALYNDLLTLLQTTQAERDALKLTGVGG